MKIKLNLIPNYKREEIKKAKSLRFIIRGGFLLALVFVFIFSGLFCFDYILKVNFNLASNSVKVGSKKEAFEKVKKMDEEFFQINQAIAGIEKIQKSQLYWSQILIKFNELVPENVVISNLTNNDYKILIFGTAFDRDSLIKFRDNLEKENCFSGVSLPLSDLVAKNDIDFRIEFNIKKECLKK